MLPTGHSYDNEPMKTMQSDIPAVMLTVSEGPSVPARREQVR